MVLREGVTADQGGAVSKRRRSQVVAGGADPGNEGASDLNGRGRRPRLQLGSAAWKPPLLLKAFWSSAMS